jgi:short-subunit dehydrogenase
MKRELRGLRGIVTGASSGIGAAIARELVQQGAQLVLVARRGEALAELSASLASAPGKTELLVGDITDPQIRAAAIDRCRQRFGGLDLLVNNAGVGAVGRFAEADADRLRRVMEVNFFAPAELIRAALPALEQGRQPLVVNIGSILAHRAIPHASEYCASKFALRGLSEALRPELSTLGVSLLNVHPGSTETEFFDHALSQGKYPWRQPRGVSPSEVAKQTVAAIRHDQRELVIGLPGKLLVWANRLAPRLVDRVLARYG